VWLVLDTDGSPVGTCVSEESAHEFAKFYNRLGKAPGLRVVEYVPALRVGEDK